MSKLELWNSVNETDPAHTKPASKGKYHFTAIAPMSQFHKATEVFGPQGLGWGVVVGSEHFQEKEYGTTTILTYDAVLFYVYKGDRGELPIHASEKSCYQTQGANGYMKIDDEVRKKVVTNAKTKGLSELGFNADVFMGMFDDPNYVDYRNLEESITKSEDREEKIKKEIEDLNDWCRKEAACYSAVKDERTLNLLLVGHGGKLQGRCQLLGLDYAKYYNGFKKSHDEQLKKIKGENNGK